MQQPHLFYRQSIGFLRAAALLFVALVVSGTTFAYPPSLEELEQQLARRQAMIEADPSRGELLQLDTSDSVTGNTAALMQIVSASDSLKREHRDWRRFELRQIKRAIKATITAMIKGVLIKGVGDKRLSFSNSRYPSNRS